ncbi:MAG TPA: outer membrane beta-barrel domain-containing protein [Steroidobacteraceae bacterium]|nr:outer membrane beta-barrel domain-containing protein [Steroidobacteraceae bacterium]
MESRLRLFLLTPLMVSILLLGTSGCSLFRHHKRNAGEDAGTSAGPVVVDSASAATTAEVTEPVLEPKVERRKIKTPKIHGSDFELGAFGGILGIEDFGSHSVYGARLDYHITESFFLEGAYGRSRGGKTSAESLFGNLQVLSSSDRNYSYYNLSLGWDALPGEVFIGRNRAYNSALYFLVGGGNTTFAGYEHFTVNGGFGYRVLVNNWVTARIDIRDYVFDTVATGPKKVVNNLEATLGLSFYF